MARSSRKPVIDDQLKQAVYSSMTELRNLLAQFDQFEACGQDCQSFRQLAHRYLQELTNIESYLIQGKPVPTGE